jgi:acylglycerol lipase
MHGTHDKATSYQATEEFASKVKVDCTLKLWYSAYHELHNEPEKIEVLTEIIDWMTKHVMTSR